MSSRGSEEEPRGAAPETLRAEAHPSPLGPEPGAARRGAAPPMLVPAEGLSLADVAATSVTTATHLSA